MRTFSACTAVLAFALPALVAGQAATPPAAEVAASVQARYDRIRDFSADFVHQYEGGVLRRKLTERGVVQIKKPGKMRWEYRTPQQKLFVSDGREMFLHEVAANQVTIFTVPKQDEAATAVLFLAGKGNVTRDFTVRYAEGGGPDTYALRLDPKTPERDYDWLEVIVDRKTYQIRSLSAADAQGGRSTFHFSNYKENTGIGDQVFTFKIPRGADVVRADPSR